MLTENGVNTVIPPEHRDRVRRILKRHRTEVDPEANLLQLEMSLAAVHNHDCPMDFEGMEQGDVWDVAHDLAGIHRFVDPTTGKLGGSFCPRYALPEVITERAPTVSFEAANGRTFLGRLIRKGHPYGREQCLVWSSDKPCIEFYDTKSQFDYDFRGSREAALEAGAPCLGQFVTRCHTDVFLEGRESPLCLDGGVLVWSLDAATRGRFADWVEEELAK